MSRLRNSTVDFQHAETEKRVNNFLRRCLDEEEKENFSDIDKMDACVSRFAI